jgi:hypothetical protein
MCIRYLRADLALVVVIARQQPENAAPSTRNLRRVGGDRPAHHVNDARRCQCSVLPLHLRPRLSVLAPYLLISVAFHAWREVQQRPARRLLNCLVGAELHHPVHDGDDVALALQGGEGALKLPRTRLLLRLNLELPLQSHCELRVRALLRLLCLTYRQDPSGRRRRPHFAVRRRRPHRPHLALTPRRSNGHGDFIHRRSRSTPKAQKLEKL